MIDSTIVIKQGQDMSFGCPQGLNLKRAKHPYSVTIHYLLFSFHPVVPFLV
jgi:hypothetical protein